MNQACEGALARSAVPVLPAIGKLAPPARRPVPVVTTWRMNRPSVPAAPAVSNTTGAPARVLFSSVSQRPSGIAWHKGKVYVVDAFNNRVQVFSETGDLLEVLGSDDGALHYPYDIAFGPADEFLAYAAQLDKAGRIVGVDLGVSTAHTVVACDETGATLTRSPPGQVRLSH